MSYYRDLREYLEALQSHGQLVRIQTAVNKDTELQPLAKLQFRGLPESQRRAFLFENVVDGRGRRYSVPVVLGALAGSPQIFATGMKCRPEEISARLAHAHAAPQLPSLVSSGLVQEEVHAGPGLLDHGGLGEFPIPVATPGFDPSPYITAPCWVTKDPNTGIRNVGMYRAMVKSPTRTGVCFATLTRGGYIHYRKWREIGKPMPAALVVGGPPCVAYVAVSPVPMEVDEFTVAGGIAGQPIDLVRCLSVDLEVPATAEVVLEGEISTSEVEPEAPFGEAYGFVGPMDINPFFTIKCITHRRNPIWLGTVSQYPPSESTQMRKHANEGALLQHLRDTSKLKEVAAVSFFEASGSLRFIAIQMTEVGPGVAWRALEAAAKRFPATKLIVAVNADVNVHDLECVTLAICMRTQPHRDYRMETLPAPALGDYSLETMDTLAKRSPTDPNRPTASRLLIDATMKWPFPPNSLPGREFMENALRIWQREGLPALELVEPWWGTNLGFWNEQDAVLAAAAARGEQYRAGEQYARERHNA